jgi:hypothetical protein
MASLYIVVKHMVFVMDWSNPDDPSLIATNLSIHYGMTRNRARRLAIARRYKEITGNQLVNESEVSREEYLATPSFDFSSYDLLTLRALNMLADVAAASNRRTPNMSAEQKLIDQRRKEKV